MIKLSKLEYLANNAVIRKRLSTIHLSSLSQVFIIRQNNSELGYLILDIYPDNKKLCIYELYVLLRFRNKKIGTKIVKYIIKYFKQKGFSVITVVPTPIENNDTLGYKETQEKLKKWYLNLGFSPSDTNRSEYNINLN